MSALNSIITSLENPTQPAKANKEINISESHESIIAIPAHLLQRAIQSCDSKTELTVFMVIARFSLGFSRLTCNVSRRFIAEWTGLKFQNVGRGIEGLISKGLIEKLPESNNKKGDCFKLLNVTLVENAALTRNQNDYTKPTQCNQIENTSGVIKLITESNQSDDGVSSKRLRSVISSITKNKEEDLEESSSASEKVKNYIASIKEAHVKRLEAKSLKQLLQKFNPSQIELALEYSQKKIQSNGNPLLMPLRYLATDTSMENVLGRAEKEANEVSLKVKVEQARVEQQVKDRAKEQQSKQNEEEAICLFEKAFPDANSQEQYVQQYLDSKFKTLRPSGNLARKFAALHWFSNESGKKA